MVAQYDGSGNIDEAELPLRAAVTPAI